MFEVVRKSECNCMSNYMSSFSCMSNYFLPHEIVPTTIGPKHLDSWRGLLTVHARVVAQIEARLAAGNLPPLTWYDALFALYEAKGRSLRVSDLADRVLLSRSGMTRLVDRLEESKLIRRESCEEDKRGAHVILTDAGIDTLRQMWPAYQRGIQELFARHLSDQEATLLDSLWRKMLVANSA